MKHFFAFLFLFASSGIFAQEAVLAGHDDERAGVSQSMVQAVRVDRGDLGDRGYRGYRGDRGDRRGRIPLVQIDGGSRHQLNVGVGFMPLSEATFDNFSSRKEFDRGYWIQTYYSGGRYMTGVWSAEYLYRVNRMVQVGGVVSYSGWYGNEYSVFSRKRVRSNSVSEYTIMPSVRFNWLNSKVVNIYSGIAVGLMMVSDVDRYHDGRVFSSGSVSRNEFRVTFAGQFTAFGIKVGRGVYGFGELCSIGSLGLARAGVGVRFGYKRFND